MLLGFALVAIGVALVSYAPSLMQKTGTSDDDNGALVAILAGSIMGIVGFGLWSPWLLGKIAGTASKLPLSVRLAVREVGRFRTRNGPIVTAILAGMSLSVLMATFYQGVREIEKRYGQYMRNDQLVVRGPAAAQAVQQIAAELNAVGSSELKTASVSNQALVVPSNQDRRAGSRIAIGGQRLLRSLGIETNLAAAVAALQAGKVLSLQPVDTSQPLRIVSEDEPDEETAIAELPAFELPTPAPDTLNIGFVVSEATAVRLGWSPSLQHSEFTNPGDWILRLSSDLTEVQFERARQIAATIPLTSVDAQFNHKLDYTYYWGILVVALMIGLIVVTVATMLASSEAKADQKILSVVGASPIVYRNQAAARSGFLTLLGCCLAIPAGLLPAMGMTSILPIMDLSIPWTQLLLGAAILPMAAALGTWLLTFPRTAVS